MFNLLILLAASLIVASGSIVINGEVITSLALTESGLAFLAKTLATRSLSVIIPRGFPSLLVTIMHPKPCSSISSATLFAGASSVMVMTGLLITSLTSSREDLNPISDMFFATLYVFCAAFLLHSLKIGIEHLKLVMSTWLQRFCSEEILLASGLL